MKLINTIQFKKSLGIKGFINSYLFIFFILFNSSCNSTGNIQSTLSIPTDIPTPIATTTPILPSAQIGVDENPIVIGYVQKEESSNYELLSAPLVQYLHEKTGYLIKFDVYEDPYLAFTALRESKIHFIFIQPLTYLAASERDLVEPLLMSNHFGLFKYGTQFLANRDSGFTTYFDSNSNVSTTTADFALRQFEGKQPCWTEPSSLSGTIIPYGILAKNGISFSAPAYLQNPTSVIRALYIKGICDFGATYALTGDPRTSSLVMNDLPDALERIVIIWQSDAIIPSLGFATANAVPLDIQNDIKSAFLSLIAEENGKSIISDALQYDVQGFISIEDDYYDSLRDFVNSANINPYQHLGY